MLTDDVFMDKLRNNVTQEEVDNVKRYFWKLKSNGSCMHKNLKLKYTLIEEFIVGVIGNFIIE